MIPLKPIIEWQQSVPWGTLAFVEQDLVVSRALVELFSSQTIADSIAFRGGTALHKLHLDAPIRYSEDIDLVALRSGPIGSIFDEIRARLDGWLGTPRRKQSESMATLTYRFPGEEDPQMTLRLKVEINVTEGEHLLDLMKKPYSVTTDWFTGKAEITTYAIDELMGSKLRALFQRKKGRDLLDLFLVLEQGLVNDEQLLKAFAHYTAISDTPITRAMFEENMFHKISSPVFRDDVSPLLPPDFEWNMDAAFELVSKRLISKLPGAKWKGLEED